MHRRWCFLLAVGMLAASCGGDASDRPEVSCVVGVAVDFSSGVTATDGGTVADVFARFVRSAQRRDEPIFGDA